MLQQDLSRQAVPEIKLQRGDEVDLEEDPSAGAHKSDGGILVPGDPEGVALVVEGQVQSSQHAVNGALQQVEHLQGRDEGLSFVFEDDPPLALGHAGLGHLDPGKVPLGPVLPHLDDTAAVGIPTEDDVQVKLLICGSNLDQDLQLSWILDITFRPSKKEPPQ